MPTVQPYSATAPVKSLAGSNTAPGITFTGDTDTGLYSPGANQVAIATGGVQRLLIGSDGTITAASPLLFSAGTASAPSITFSGDTDTGLYSPGANQVAISTNGTGRLFVSDDGVATGGAPQFGFGGIQVRNSFIYVNEDGANTTQMYLRTASNEAAIQVATNHPFKIQTNNQERLRITSAGALNFVGAGTAGSTQAVSFNGSAPVNSLVVDASGNVGVGEASPQGRFHVSASGAGAYVGQILDNTSSTGYVQQLFRIGNAGANGEASIGYVPGTFFAIGPTANDTTTPIIFRNNNATERLRITSSGLVGIGTSVPNYQLHVTSSFAVGAAGFNQQLTFSNDTIQSLLLGTGYTALKLNPLGGNVGVGTSSPASLVHIAGGGSGRKGALRFSDAGGTNFWEIGRDNGVNGSFTFTQNGVERLCIDYAAGNVGVGTQSPSASLHTETSTTGEIARFVNTNTTAGYGVYIKAGGTFGGRYSIKIDDAIGNEQFKINQDGIVTVNTTTSTARFNLKAASSQHPLIVETSSTEALRVDSSGRLLVGTSSARSNFYNDTNSAFIQLESASNDGSALALIQNFNASTLGGQLILAKSNATSVGSNTLVASGNICGQVSFQGNDGSQFVEAAQIRGEIDGTPGANDMPGRLVFSTTADGASSPTERMRIDSSGRVGVGTTSPGSYSGQVVINISPSGDHLVFADDTTSSGAAAARLGCSGNNLVFKTNSASSAATERARIDSSGRLLVGTSTIRAVEPNGGSTSGASLTTHFEGSGAIPASLGLIHNGTTAAEGSALYLARTRGTAAASSTLVNSGDNLGTIAFAGGDGTDIRTKAAEIYAVVDGTPGTNNMPGRLVFSTTADGASSPTERLRITSSGQVLVAGSGTAASPSIAVGNDTNTGLYSPGADQVAISTNGTGRLFVDASGNIKVSTGEIFQTSASSYIRLDGGTGSGTGANVIVFGESHGSAPGRIALSAVGTGAIVASTGGSERLRITSAGLVGVGTSSPSYQFHVSNTGANALGVFTRTSGASTYIEGGSTTGTIGTVGSHNLVFTTNSSSAITIDTSQRVGVGTTSPGFLLDLFGNTPALRIKANGVGNGVKLEQSSATGDVELNVIDGYPLAFKTSNTERARIDSSGRLLVGTTSTVRDSRLCVRGNASGSFTGDMELGAAAGYASIASDNTIGVFRFTESTNGGIFAQIYAESDATPGNNDYPGRLVFSTTADGASSPTERLRITSSGQVLVSGSGSAASPSISVGNDTNTGIYSPSADSVAISTNGQGRLFVDASGNVGVGAASAGSKLDVSGVIATNDALYIYNAAKDGLGIWYNPGASGVGQLTARIAGSDRMTITSAGLVGVGTSSPYSRLTVVPASDPTTPATANQITIGEVTANSNYRLQLGYFVSGAYRGSIQSYDNGSPSDLIINGAGGRLGVGTSSPGELLHVNGGNQNIRLSGSYAGNQSNKIEINNGQSGATRYAVGLELSSSAGGNYTSAVYNSAGSDTRYAFITAGPTTTSLLTANTTRLFIDSSGLVGVGTTSPAYKLDVTGGGIGVNTSAGTAASVVFNQSGVGVAEVGMPASENALTFKTWTGAALTERARIDNSGRLLVGTSSARSPLTHTPSIQVEGLGYATSTVSVISNSNDTNGAYSFLGKTRGISLGSNTIVQSGDEIGGLDFIAADGTQLLRAARITALVDGTPGANDMPGRLVFSTTADGASSPTERLRITSTGQIQSAGLGSAASPALSFTTDTNTGIYSPGADQLAISTNGSGRLFVDASGNISNTSGFNPYATANRGSITINGTTSSIYALGINGIAAGYIYADSVGVAVGAPSSKNIVFDINGEKARITSAGLVGVGTSSPTENVTIYGSSSRLAVTGGSGSSAILLGNQNSSGANNPSVIEAANGALYFGGGNSWSGGGTFDYTMTLTNDNKVGVGTTSPSATLDVNGNVRVNSSVGLEIASSSNATIVYKPGGSANAYYTYIDSSRNYIWQDLATERMRIDSSGRLLVGTSSESGNSRFAVRGNTGSATGAGVLDIGLGTTRPGSAGTPIGYIRFTSTSNTGSNYHYASIAAESDGTSSSDTDIPGRLVFSTTADGASSPTERMRIPNGGGLSVGTTVSPSAVNQQTAIRIGTLNVSQTTISNLTTTWTDITVAAGANGLAFVDVYDTSAGTQGNFLVSWRGYPANATVISSNNGTGLTINFQVSSGKLQMQTTSGTVSGAAYVWAS